MSKDWKILCIGNSFSQDTTRHLVEIAHRAGIEKIKVGNLYIGGCSIKLHYSNAINDAPAYDFSINDGSGWKVTPNTKIGDALKSETWDWVAIQHGTQADGSSHLELECYSCLPALLEYIKERTKAKTAFNMTWVYEPDFVHKDLAACNNDPILMYQKVAELTKNHIEPLENLDLVSPTGTAIQNCRTNPKMPILTRDKFHLSENFACYIAGLVFLKALTGVEKEGMRLGLDPVTEDIIKRAVEAAIKTPYKITEII